VSKQPLPPGAKDPVDPKAAAITLPVTWDMVAQQLLGGLPVVIIGDLIVTRNKMTVKVPLIKWLPWLTKAISYHLVAFQRTDGSGLTVDGRIPVSYTIVDDDVLFWNVNDYGPHQASLRSLIAGLIPGIKS
jgi:hypothetical protein